MSWLGGLGATPTDSAAFRGWFRKSKAVDEQGAPLILFHGTHRFFSEFSRERVGEASRNAGFFGDAFYMTNDAGVAGMYAGKEEGAQIVPVYASIQNPLVLSENEASFKRALTFSRRKLLALQGWTQAEVDLINAKEIMTISEATARMRRGRFREVATANGHDGVHVKNSVGSMNADEWVAFEPTQIKSALGNRGTWDGSDPNILHGWHR